MKAIDTIRACSNFVEVCIDLDEVTSARVEWLSPHSSSMIVLDMEYFNIVPLRDGHHKQPWYSFDNNVIRFPREVAAMLFERTSPNRWRITGYYFFVCSMPNKNSCALIPSKSSTVSSPSRRHMESIEFKYFNPMGKWVKSAERCLGQVLDSNDDSLFKNEQVVHDVVSAVRSVMEEIFPENIVADRLMSKLVDIQRNYSLTPDTVEGLRKILSRAEYCIQYSSNQPVLVQNARNQSLSVYEFDPYIASHTDHYHDKMRKLISAMNVSRVVYKELQCIDAIRNHCIRYGLKQVRSGLYGFDISIYNENSRINFGDAKLPTTARALPYEDWTHTITTSLNRYMSDFDISRETPSPLQKCIMISRVALHIAMWFAVEIQDHCVDEEYVAWGEDNV